MSPLKTASPDSKPELRSRNLAPLDPQTVTLAQKGDPAALTALVQALSPGIFRFALRMARSEEEARDITQDTFLRMIKSLDRYDPAWSFSTWVYRIARNLCIDKARHKSRWRFRWPSRNTEELEEEDPMSELPDGKDSQLDRLLSLEVGETLEQALLKLKPNYREILVLYHFEELSYQDIAQVLGLPLGTVMNRIFRARQQLRELLGDTLAPA
ncbi:MAG: RNA polymerase sigma factor [Myxococcota bacterium]